MEFMVEGQTFLSQNVAALVAVAEAASGGSDAPDVDVAAEAHAPALRLRIPKGGRKGWKQVLLTLNGEQSMLLPVPADYAVAAGDALTLGCLGPVRSAGGTCVALMEIYAVSNENTGLRHSFHNSADVMKRCGVTRARQYETEKFPLKKVCKISLIVFFVALACFGYLMHLFTENMDELTARLSDVLMMSAKFGAVAFAVIAAGGGLYVKSSNDYNMRKKLEEYRVLFERAMGVEPESSSEA